MIHDKNSPWLVILAGPNGAGKSTFYDKVIQEWSGFRNIQFVNMDNYAKYMAKSIEDVDKYMTQAARVVKGMIDDNIEKQKSFI